MSLNPYMRHPLLCLVRRRLQHVILHVTDRCSLRCKTCFVAKRGRDLQFQDAQAIARKLGRVRWLDIGGGEPFLHPELPAICGLFPDSEITIPTNGQDPEHIHETALKIASVRRGPLTLAVSLDGFEQANDRIRGAGAYRKAVRTLELLRGIRSLVLKVNTVVCNLNAGELTAFMRHVRDLGPDYHSLLLVRGRPEDPAIALPPLEDLDRMTGEVLEILGSYTYGDGPLSVSRLLKKRYQRYLWRVSLKTLKSRKCQVPCKAPYLHKVIYPDGALSLCELMPPVGNILEEPLASLERKMADFLEGHERAHGPCFCTHNCNLGENIQTHPRSVLSILLGLDP